MRKQKVENILLFLGNKGFALLGDKVRNRIFKGKVAVPKAALPEEFYEYLPGLSIGEMYDRSFIIHTKVSPLPMPVLKSGPESKEEIFVEIIEELQLRIEDELIDVMDGYGFVRRTLTYYYNKNVVSTFIYAYVKA